MSETAKQYIARILSYSNGSDAWQILASSPGRARDLTGNLTPAQIGWKRDADQWSIRQILAHLADAEIVAAWRLRAILAEDGVPLQAFDQNSWAAAFQYDQVEASESLDVFAILRRANLRLLKSIDPALHQNAGMHAERGRESVDHLIRLYAGHDLNHLMQLERLASAARERDRSS